jgi:outer membrane protein TolC
MQKFVMGVLALIAFWACSWAWSSSGAAPNSSNQLSLSPQDIVSLVLKQGPQTREIQLQTQESRLVPAEALKVFDFNLNAVYGYQDSKFETLSTPALVENKTNTTQLTLSKGFQTGTQLALQYTGTTARPQVTSGTGLDSSEDIAGLILTQNLWRNFFGRGDRAAVNAADLTWQSAQLSGLVNLQTLALNALQAYWRAYVSQETFQAAVKSRNRYLKLKDSIQKKNRYGYTSPGELTQAEAELEGREQTVKTESANYLLALDQLKTLLGFSPDTQIQFNISLITEAPPPPSGITPVVIEKSRRIRSSSLAAEAASATLTAVESQSAPDLSLIAQYYVQGLDQDPNTARQEMGDGIHPQYYVGVRFQHSFGSGYQDENINNKRFARDLAQAQLERQKLEFKDTEEDVLRRLQSTYAIYLSSRTQRDLREKAGQELAKSFTQGRTDVSILIDALNKFFDAESQVSRSLADYEITRSQWLALQDRLVTEEMLKSGKPL